MRHPWRMKQVVFDLGGARNAMKTRPPIYTKYYDLLNWILDKTGKFPKNIRFSLVQKVDNIAIDILEDIIEALYRRDREAMHQSVNIKFEKLRIFLRLCHDRGLLSGDQLRFAVGEIDEIGRMWHGWTGRKDDEKSGKSI